MYFKLIGKKIVATDNVIDWGRWLEYSGQRVIRQTHANGFIVSTIFIGLDQGHGRTKKPLLFETMVFSVDPSDEKDYLQSRAATLHHAKIIHWDVVKYLRRKKLMQKQSRITKLANERIFYSARNAKFKVRSTGLSNTVFRPRKKRHTGFSVFRSKKTKTRG